MFHRSIANTSAKQALLAPSSRARLASASPAPNAPAQQSQSRVLEPQDFRPRDGRAKLMKKLSRPRPMHIAAELIETATLTRNRSPQSDVREGSAANPGFDLCQLRYSLYSALRLRSWPASFWFWSLEC